MPTIACLHTVESNVALFSATCPPGLRLTHTLRSDLLAGAGEPGRRDAALAATAAALQALAGGADAVLLTCSTVGPAASVAAERADVPVIRADRALADAATAAGGTVVVLCAAPTTLGPTGELFEESAARTGARVDLRLVEGAWEAFRAGDVGAYHRRIAAAADGAFAEGIAIVALAQASMSGAAELARLGKPLTVPETSLDALARRFGE
jgi:hypothetical protein